MPDEEQFNAEDQVAKDIKATSGRILPPNTATFQDAQSHPEMQSWVFEEAL